MTSKFIKLEATVTPTAAAYTANDVVGGLITIPLREGTNRPSILGGILNQIVITDSSDQGANLTVVLFREVPSTIGDKDAYAPTVADSRKRFATSLVSSWTDRTSHQESEIENINKAVKADGKNNFYMYVVDVDGTTFGTDPIYFTFDILTE